MPFSTAIKPTTITGHAIKNYQAVCVDVFATPQQPSQTGFKVCNCNLIYVCTLEGKSTTTKNPRNNRLVAGKHLDSISYMAISSLIL
jgi:hypothetical protein